MYFVLSFFRRNMLRQEFVPGRDILIYVGTLNGNLTEDPEHRGRLIAAVVIEPSQVLETRRIISKNFWSNLGEQWPHAMAVLKAAVMEGPPYPKAHDVIPNAYRQFALMENRGGIAEAIGEERAAVMALPITPLDLHLSPEVQAYINVRASVSETPKSIREEQRGWPTSLSIACVMVAPNALSPMPIARLQTYPIFTQC